MANGWQRQWPSGDTMVVLVPLVPHGAAAAAAAPGWWWCCGRAGSQGGVGCDRCVVVWVFGVFFFLGVF